MYLFIYLFNPYIYLTHIYLTHMDTTWVGTVPLRVTVSDRDGKLLGSSMHRALYRILLYMEECGRDLMFFLNLYMTHSFFSYI